MELLTLPEFWALSDCHHAAIHRLDRMHARTAISMGGGNLESILMTHPPRGISPREKSGEELMALLEEIPGVTTIDG